VQPASGASTSASVGTISHVGRSIGILLGTLVGRRYVSMNALPKQGLDPKVTQLDPARAGV
jgi:hypothetical protein